MADNPLRLRSLFFVPGGRADLIGKLSRWTPDVAVLDLEDAVSFGDKDKARVVAVSAAADLVSSGYEGTLYLRVNRSDTPWFAEDLAAAADGPFVGLVLPKLEKPGELERVEGMPVIAGIETVRGVADARDLVTPALSGVYYGAEDFIADLGGRRTTGGAEVLYGRSQVSIAAHLAGVPAIDQAVVDPHDHDGFLADAGKGRDLGYRGKICIHPSQVSAAHEVFSPSEQELAHAREVLQAYERGSGVVMVDGQMVDLPHVRMAENLVRTAEVDRV
jgi:citrate lyase subunit beta/citryl-CoA lyase